MNVIGVMELFYQAQKIQTMNYQIFETYVIVCVMYFIVTFAVTRILRFFEKKLAGNNTYVICGSQSDSAAEIRIKGENSNG